MADPVTDTAVLPVDEIVPQQNWSLYQNLALGTTTIHDPSSQASEIFTAAELQRIFPLEGSNAFSLSPEANQTCRPS